MTISAECQKAYMEWHKKNVSGNPRYFVMSREDYNSLQKEPYSFLYEYRTDKAPYFMGVEIVFRTIADGVECL